MSDAKLLTTRQLNRALLARQLLLERSQLSLTKALEQIGGLQAQYAPSAYIGLWSRLDGFELADLTRALERRRAVQATLLRSTIHIVSARDYWPFAVGIRRSRIEWWERAHGKRLGRLDMKAAAESVRAALGDGVKQRDEMIELCRAFHVQHATAVWNGLPLELVRVPPSGTWERRRADLYASAESWLGPSSSDEAAGLELLLRRYLAGFGPARLTEAANWAGVDVKTLRPATERLRLKRFADEDGKELLDLPRSPRPAADVRAPVRFLPTWDATLLVHARRTQILPEAYRPLVFDTKTPHSVPTFLVDGTVAGTWRIERSARAATVTVEPFAPLPRPAKREISEEAERLVRFVDPEAPSHAVRLASDAK